MPPEEGENAPAHPPVSPILSIDARVLCLANVGRGSRADYEGYLPPEVERVALVSLGNWDIPGFFSTRDETGEGVFSRSGDSSGRCVRIGEHLCRMAGSPCMDTFCVDITGLYDIKESDRVRILGDEDGIRIEDWLSHTGLGFGDCQMLFAGMQRVNKRLV